MSWFNNQRIATKLILGFTLVALISAVVGMVGIISMGAINKADTELYEENLIPIVYLSEMTQTFQEVRSYMYYAMLVKNQAERTDAIDKMNERRAAFSAAYEAYGKIIVDDEDRQMFDKLTEARKAYAEAYGQAIQLMEESRLEEAIALVGDNGAYGKALKYEQDVITDIINMQTAHADEKAMNNMMTGMRATVIMLVIIVAGVLFAVGIGFYLSRLISKPLMYLKDASNKLALGDTDVNIEHFSKDEIGDLMESFSKMVSNIEEQARNAQKIAHGDLTIEIHPKSDKDILSFSMQQVITELRKLIDEVNGLTRAAAEGELSVRVDVEAFEGGYKEIIKGVNNTLDVIVETLNEAGEVLKNISVNDYTKGMSDVYKGDLKDFADSINDVRSRLLSIQSLFEDFASGNTEQLEKFEAIGRRSENDKLIPATVKLMHTIRNLIHEANMLAQAAVGGDLSVRGNIDKFEGGYKDIIQGMNNTMDAIVEPIEEVSQVLQQMAEKDLTGNIKGDYKGEYAKIKDAMNDTLYSLNEILMDITIAAEQVETGADQVANASQALSQGASEQASSIEEMSATITEVAEQTKGNADNAIKANELSERAKNEAKAGTMQMEEMLKAMNVIKDSSRNISNIIKVIDEIAFQTNILALNAAVEAARAGEHGKGFAVVAEEVRNLAARSAKAAKETTDMIDDSIKQVEEGYIIANDTADALNKIVLGVTDVGEIVEYIAQASKEQNSAITEINIGIEQISQVIQNNTATAEESASASEEMAGQSQMLKEMIQQFKLKGMSQKSNNNPQKIYQIKKPDYRLNTIVLDDEGFGKY